MNTKQVGNFYCLLACFIWLNLFVLSSNSLTAQIVRLLPNGNFESGSLNGWTISGNGVVFVVQEGTRYSSYATECLSLNGTYAANVRSANDVYTVGVLTSAPFFAGDGISFFALSETTSGYVNPVSFEVRLLDAATGQILISQGTTTNIVSLSSSQCNPALFSHHSVNTTPFIKRSVRVQFRQHTNVSGLGFFTLVDDVSIINPPPLPLSPLLTENGGSPVTTETAAQNGTISSLKQGSLAGHPGQGMPPGVTPSNTCCENCPPCPPWYCAVQTGITAGVGYGLDAQAGDPVHLNNLEFTYSMIDLEIQGRGLNYRLERHYRSRINFLGVLGYNWEHSYDMRVVPHPTQDDQVILYDGKGRGDAYIVLSDGSYVGPNFYFKKMVQEADGTLLLRQANGTVFKFYALDSSSQAGKLAAIRTRCGNQMTFAYNDAGQLSQVLDSLSRPIQYLENE
jgi:YD repeat-containing protein